MKKTIKGICYDTETAAPKCTYRHGNPAGSILETSYQTGDGYYFLLQTVKGSQKIIPMTNDDMSRWSAIGNSGKPFI